jgi:hypothetical protein
VRYINVDGHRDWLLHDYHRRAKAEGTPTWPDPRPGWDRIRPEYNAWLANLRAERIQILVVARANPAEGVHNVADAEGFPIERGWADAHPETFAPLYGVIERDPLMRIYRVRPPLERAAPQAVHGSCRKTRDFSLILPVDRPAAESEKAVTFESPKRPPTQS